MDDRPFYELDDEELVLAEATQAALSTTAPRMRTPALPAQKLYLQSRLDRDALNRIHESFSAKASLGITDHALLLNACACILDRDGNDGFGLDTALRNDSALLLIEQVRPRERSMTANHDFPDEALERLLGAPMETRTESSGTLALMLRPGDIRELRALAEDQAFIAMRRVTLALLPAVAKYDETIVALRNYAVTIRISISALAAQWNLLPWTTLIAPQVDQADKEARALIDALRKEFL